MSSMSNMKQEEPTTPTLPPLIETTSQGGSVPEFIQKLFRMLENSAFKDTFSWSEDGTTFIVKDTNEFSRSILPQHFKHCNFASFVRQLNKYDFHKVRNGEDGQPRLYGDQAWEFIHPKFHRDHKELLEDIKRKAPGAKITKKVEKPAVVIPKMIDNTGWMHEIKELGMNLQQQIDQLKKSTSSLEQDISKLNQADYQISNQIVDLNKNMSMKDSIIKDFLEIVSNDSENSKAQDLLDKYAKISTKNMQQINKLELKPKNKLIEEIKQDPDTLAAAAAASMNAGSLIGSPLKTADGLTFVTLGRLSSNMSVRDNKPAIEIMAADQQSTANFVNRTSSQPTPTAPTTNNSPVSWTVPPRILLVDDDSVYRELSGKLLQVIGCSIDLAKDGVEALKKMGTEKYDLILMDIVMPKMDGISATRSIRQYDALTPIISMTSNFTDNDIMQYIGSGMTDILPKPFSKRTLYQMLEKYCAHLKTIQRVTGLDPSTGFINPLPLPSPLLSIPQQQQPPPPPYTASSTNSSVSSSSTANTPTAFPLAPYPYPVTMNSVPEFNNTGEIPHVTFWPQQSQQAQDQPPAIIPNDGKFQWAVPTSAASNGMDASNKRRRMNEP